MKLNAYAIFDNKALVYHAPFFAPTDGSAVRSLTDLVGDSNTGVSRHPGDYVLYCIGSYDDAVGGMLPISPLKHVIDAVALVKLQPSLDLETMARRDRAAEALKNGEA